MANVGKILKQYERAKSAAGNFRERWKEFEDLAYARLARGDTFKSQVREGTLSSLIYERVCRVCAQPPSGEISALTKHDIGKTRLLNLVWNNYILPNANTYRPSRIKSWMVDYYSLVYGAMPAVHFYRADDEYTGPDWRPINPRYVYPEAGRTSPQDADFVFVDTFHSPSELKSWRGRRGYDDKVIDELIEAARQGGENAGENSNIAMERGEASDVGQGQVRLTTKYNRGKGKKWLTFDSKSGKIVREIKNPYESGRVPVVWKMAQPLIDSFYGLGDIERGEALQRAEDSIVNMYMDSMKLKLLPIVRYDSDINPEQIPFRPAAKWRLGKNQNVSTVNITGNSSQEFQAGSQFIKASLLNQNGTTDTTISADQKFPGYGKSPEALHQLKERENARDNADRQLLEDFHAELYEGMLEDLSIAARVDAPEIDFWLFGDDIQQIAEAGYSDILEISDSAIAAYVDPATKQSIGMDEVLASGIDTSGLQPVFNGKGSAKIKIKPELLAGKYRYLVDPGSSMATSQKDKLETLGDLFNFLSGNGGQMVLESLQKEGKEFHPDVLFQDYLSAIGVQNKDKLITEIPESEQAAENGGNMENMSAPEIGENVQDFSPEDIQDEEIRRILMG